MKSVLSVFLLSIILLQISCGPRTSVYRGNTLNSLISQSANNGEIPAWVQGLAPHVKLVHYAEHYSSDQVAEILHKYKNDIKPIYISVAMDKAVTRGDLGVIKVILDATGSRKKLHATAALGKVKSKKMLDFFISQGGELNGIDSGKIDMKDTVSLLAKNGPLSNMGSEYNLESAKLLIEAGADPYREIAPGHTVLDSLITMEKEFKKHDVLKKQAGNLTRIVSYIKTSEKRSDTESAVVKGDLQLLKGMLNSKNILTVNKRGFTLLHHAARANQLNVAKYLVIKSKRLLSAKDNAGNSALDLVKNKKNEVAKYLSCKQNNYCQSVVSFEQRIKSSCAMPVNLTKCRAATSRDIHGVFLSNEISNMVAKAEYNSACEKFNFKNCQHFIQKFPDSKYIADAKAAVDNYKNKRAESLFVAACGVKGNASKCKNLNVRYPGMYPQQRVINAISFLSQKCRLNESGWIYTGSQCKGSKAHGKGKAINSDKKLSYKGRFNNGERVKGKVYYDGQPMFDGALTEGKPNGIGVCFFNGDPEKCEYYEGKRIDVLYKQRIAMAKQQEQMDKKLSEMKSMQEQQNKRISQIQGQVRTGQSQTTKSGSGGIGQQVGDYALKKAGEKVMDKLFDRLF